jgi:hypothetical protein
MKYLTVQIKPLASILRLYKYYSVIKIEDGEKENVKLYLNTIN